MAEQVQNEIPRRILLATDLSARCDRALDRAARLAAEWKAHLVVVHALEWDFQGAWRDETGTPSWRRDATRRMAIARQQIHDDLLDHEVPFDIVIEEGEPTEIVLKAAETHRCDLIVTGTARSETFGRFVLGTTVERLARRAGIPVLVVKSRGRQSYRKVAVGTDFSDASRHALERTAGLFPQAALVLLHSYWPIVGTLSKDRAADAAAHKLASEDCARFLAEATLPQQSRAMLQAVVEAGPLESMVTAYARDKGLDLLVIGARGRNPVLNLLLGSTAEKILGSAPCDVLIIRKK
jgi:nucleotide-binding universal stress UspA family protein